MLVRLDSSRNMAEKKKSKPLNLLRFFSRSSSKTSSESAPSTSTSTAEKRVSENEPESSSAKKPKKAQGGQKKVSTVRSWQATHPWVEYEASGASVVKVWCKFCRRKPEIVKKWNKTTGKVTDVDSYVTGTTNVKMTNIKRHEISKGHQMAKG